jgi:hypothetical protein
VRGPHDGRELECRGGGEGGERERERGLGLRHFKMGVHFLVRVPGLGAGSG